MNIYKPDERNEEVFEALLKIAIKESNKREIEAMPSCEVLDKIYEPSSVFSAKISGIISRQEKNKKFERIIGSIGKIAAVFSIFFLASFIVLLSVEASRNFIFNTIISMRSDHAIIEFGKSNDYTPDAMYELGYLPMGFNFKESQSAGNLQIKIYENVYGEQIIFETNISNMPTIGVDIEHTEYAKTIVNGYEAYLFSAFREDGFSVITWATDTVVFKLSSSIDTDELMKVAEGIVNE